MNLEFVTLCLIFAVGKQGRKGRKDAFSLIFVFKQRFVEKRNLKKQEAQLKKKAEPFVMDYWRRSIKIDTK